MASTSTRKGESTGERIEVLRVMIEDLVVLTEGGDPTGGILGGGTVEAALVDPLIRTVAYALREEINGWAKTIPIHINEAAQDLEL